MIINSSFPRYNEYSPKVPVWCATPNEGRIFHRFFDTSPFSPSGRYLGLVRIPYEDRLPSNGDEADIVIVDLKEGKEWTVSKTRGWEHQMGANVNWGKNDSEIVYNDVDIETWKPFGVVLNIETKEKKKFDGCVYHVSPSGKYACSSNPTTRRRTQPGYGVVVPDEYMPVVKVSSENEGLFVTNLETLETKLLLSMKDIFERTHTKKEIEEKMDGECYLFHSKYSRSSKKIMFSTRWIPSELHNHPHALATNKVRFNVFTCNEDGSNLQRTISEKYWINGGHHTTWHPDEEHLTMNLKYNWGKLLFAKASLDGKTIEPVFENTLGSGHPTFHPNGKFLITDTYVFEKVAYGDGTTPIRLVHLASGENENIIRINTLSPFQENNSILRVDPHVAFDKTNRYIAFNAFVGGTRRVFVADLEKYL